MVALRPAHGCVRNGSTRQAAQSWEPNSHVGGLGTSAAKVELRWGLGDLRKDGGPPALNCAARTA